jgi:hypothetical protein
MRISLGRGLGAAVLVLAPAAGVVNTAASPAGDGSDLVSTFADHPDEANLVLATDALSLLMIPAIALVALLVWRREPRFAMAGGMFAILGLGVLALCTGLDLIAKAAADAGDTGAGPLLTKAHDSPLSHVATHIGGGCQWAGFLLLFGALWRSRAVPRWAAGAFVVSAALGIATMILPLMAIVVYVLPSPAVLAVLSTMTYLAGFVGCAGVFLRNGIGPAPADPPPAAPPAASGSPLIVPAV